MSTGDGAQNAPDRPCGCTQPSTPADAPAWVRLWLAPIQHQLDVVAATSATPVAELTMSEVLAWATVVSYSAVTGMIIGRLAAGLALAAIRGPHRR